MPHKNEVFPRPSIVSPPPSIGKGQAANTELDAALAHLRPQWKRLLPNLPVKTKTVPSKIK